MRSVVWLAGSGFAVEISVGLIYCKFFFFYGFDSWMGLGMGLILGDYSGS